jgi:hypothetical protein
MCYIKSSRKIKFLLDGTLVPVANIIILFLAKVSRFTSIILAAIPQ